MSTRTADHHGRYVKSHAARLSVDVTSPAAHSDDIKVPRRGDNAKTKTLDNKRSFFGWFRHKGDSYETQKNNSSASLGVKTGENKKKKAKLSAPGSLSDIARLSDSLPSLALRCPTSHHQQPQTGAAGAKHQNHKSQLCGAAPTTTKRSESRRTPSGRNRWSSYELVGAAALSLAAATAAAEAQAGVDDEFHEPAAAPAAVDNGLAVDQRCSAETVDGAPCPAVADSHASRDTPSPREIAADPPADKDPTPTRERRSSYDEILGELRLADDEIESCRARQRHLLAALFHIPPNSFTSFAEQARLRPRDDDRCALLLSLLSDAERLTSYINSLLCVDERQPRQMLGADDTGRAMNGQNSEDTMCSPKTGSRNGGCTTSGVAKTLADFSANLRTQLAHLSVQNNLADAGTDNSPCVGGMVDRLETRCSKHVSCY